MKVAAVAYACERLPDWAAHEAKLDALLREAAADLVVLPEYAAMEAALIAGPMDGSAVAWRDRAAARAGEWVERHRRAAMRHGCHILAGSGPVATARGVVNRSWLVAPSGEVVQQDKLIPTPYERTEMQLIAGEGLSVFESALGRIGILVCYDSEFPLLARALTEAGAEILLVPSCTDFPAGQTRVRVSARARAIEAQCPVVQAPLVGAVPGCEVIDVSTGRAAIFAPADHGLPADGVLAQGETDRPGAVVAEIDLAWLGQTRDAAQVGNAAHWPEQGRHIAGVKTRRLR